MVRITVAGASGRMGGRIVDMVHQNPGSELAGAFEHPEHENVGKDAGSIAGIGALGVKIFGSLDEAINGSDVLIDFTQPESTLHNMRETSEKGIATVIGTTGIPEDGVEKIKALAEKIPCVLAPNMSVGVNVMFKIAGEMARILGDDYDMEILEAHHRLKKDAPSGTAMRLGEILADAVGRDLEKVGVYGRKGMIGERTDEEIGIQTWRAGDIAGEHTVMFGGIGERLELVHRAHNRDNFARGAVRAALWITGQPAGLYDMQDVLGLK